MEKRKNSGSDVTRNTEGLRPFNGLDNTFLKQHSLCSANCCITLQTYRYHKQYPLACCMTRSPCPKTSPPRVEDNRLMKT
mmetsp:Transcript_90674/g.170973  ORF Transcript_90674/g.170973 Transcript_90674/m.170973 type:complete len:80 (+) Transcript_90674:39-278(+)